MKPCFGRGPIHRSSVGIVGKLSVDAARDPMLKDGGMLDGDGVGQVIEGASGQKEARAQKGIGGLLAQVALDVWVQPLGAFAKQIGAPIGVVARGDGIVDKDVEMPVFDPARKGGNVGWIFGRLEKLEGGDRAFFGGFGTGLFNEQGDFIVLVGVSEAQIIARWLASCG